MHDRGILEQQADLRGRHQTNWSSVPAPNFAVETQAQETSAPQSSQPGSPPGKGVDQMTEHPNELDEVECALKVAGQ
jgi:hypothetical protein